ncbi:Glu/Leu/Phe/Val dehydrogenase dimerization domain-containing protein [Micromonospora sp. NPDC047134]|uniref:Glu/Leu/Phe/Val family dehydrogenase n=1 Tax=Micromonospora sp. NPDC047134 TaxID=3154340 RepID=UPI0033E6EDBB
MSAPQPSAPVLGRFPDFPHEQVTFCQDPETGLRAIIAVHDSTLGPAVGGTRMHPYATEAEALTDVLRLSRGMTYKNAVAGLPCGGGKAVIIGDPDTVKSEALLETYGRFVQSLGGRYVTAGDVGISAADLDVIGRGTDHVLGRTTTAGGYGDSGPMTAYGAFHALRAAAAVRWGTADLAGRSVGVEGLGKVGYELARLLVEAGAGVTAADLSGPARERARRDLPAVLLAERVIDAPVDIYAPCALGAVLTSDSVPTIRAAVICGAANNQLATPEVEEQLAERDILWVPDFVASAGGVTIGCAEYRRIPLEEVPAQVAKIFDTVTEVLGLARGQGMLPGAAAEDLAHTRIQQARTGLKPGYLPR